MFRPRKVVPLLLVAAVLIGGFGCAANRESRARIVAEEWALVTEIGPPFPDAVLRHRIYPDGAGASYTHGDDVQALSSWFKTAADRLGCRDTDIDGLDQPANSVQAEFWLSCQVTRSGHMYGLIVSTYTYLGIGNTAVAIFFESARPPASSDTTPDITFE